MDDVPGALIDDLIMDVYNIINRVSLDVLFAGRME